jgi:peroxiredoxin Q/BCP
MAATLSVGSEAPDFSLSDQHGKTVRLSDFKGRKLLVYFYPKADTPGCTKQSCSVRDARPDLVSLGVDAVGISADSVEDQARFDARYSLGFPLLADTDHAVCEAWGVQGEKGITRSSFLVGEDGRLIGVWYRVKPEETVPKARAALAGLP